MLYAVDDVSFDIEKGETLGLVGESGCGKSTLGRCLIRLLDSTAGKVLLQDREGGGYTDVTKVNASTMKELRRRVQIVFQDPYSCLNPRLSVWELIAEPLIVNNVYGSKAEMRKRIRELMSTVGLAERLENSYPHELDGGRRQPPVTGRTAVTPIALAVRSGNAPADQPPRVFTQEFTVGRHPNSGIVVANSSQ